MLTTPQTFGTSHGVYISIHLRWSGPEKLNRNRNGRKLNSMAENSILCPNGRNSIVWLHGTISNPQMYGRTPTSQHHVRTSTSQHHGRTSTESFSKSSKFSAHLFFAWRHRYPSLGFIMTMVIVITFACERKPHQFTTHLNSKPE